MGDAAAGLGALAVIEDRKVEVAVLETARGGLLKNGIYFDRSDVSAVLNVTADHLGIDQIETLEQMAELKARVAQSARELVVLNADDALTLAMVEGTRSQRVALVSLEEGNPVIEQHLGDGGIGLVVEGSEGCGKILKLCDGQDEFVIGKAGEFPATMQGLARHNIFNALVATGLAYGLGVPLEEISKALKTFHSDFASNPGRLNVFENCPFTVVLDYAHNPEGMEVACDTLAGMEVPGKRVVVLGTAGNRHGDHIERAARVVAGRFDKYLCTRDNTYSRQDDGSRGFPAAEIPERLVEALRQQGVEAGKIEAVGEFQTAVERSFEFCDRGDMILIFTDEYRWCRDQILEQRRQFLDT